MFPAVSVVAGMVVALEAGKWLRCDWRRRSLIGIVIMICGESTTAVAAPPPVTTIAETPIPDIRFPTYVKFATDPLYNGLFSNQAHCKLAAMPQGPIFMAGFFNNQDF